MRNPIKCINCGRELNPEFYGALELFCSAKCRYRFMTFAYREPLTKKNELINIDIDLIKTMKLRGMKSEASRLLQAFRSDVQKTKRIELHNIRKIDRLILKTAGICTICLQRKTLFNNDKEQFMSYCKECYVKYKHTKRTHQCKKCGEWFITGYKRNLTRFCSRCRNIKRY